MKHLAMALLGLTACVMDDNVDDTELAEIDQELAESWFVPFHAAGATGVSPDPPTRTEVVDGMLGWSGEWHEYPLLGWIQDVVFRTSTLSGTKTGLADLAWGSFSLPADGTYRLSTTDSPIRIRGFTKVKGKGNAFTSIDAKSEAYLYIFVSVGSTLVYQSGPLLGRDETKSESRTKSFDKEFYLPNGLTFTGEAGDDVTLLVRVQSRVWSNTDGAAELGIREFGIPAVTADRLVAVQR